MRANQPCVAILGDPIPAAFQERLHAADIDVAQASTVGELPPFRFATILLVMVTINETADDPKSRAAAHAMKTMLTELIEDLPPCNCVLVLIRGSKTALCDRFDLKLETQLRRFQQLAAVTAGVEVVINALDVPTGADEELLVDRLLDLIVRGEHVATGEVIHVDEIQEQSISDALLARYL